MGLFDWLGRVVGGETPRPRGPVVSSDWLAWPTLAGGDVQQVAGESHNQGVLEKLAGGRTPDGARRQLFMAQLLREPENPYDRNAVHVEIGGELVGRLPRDDATAFQDLLRALEQRERPATCHAWITGGFTSGATHFGVELDLRESRREALPEDPFLPSRRDDACVAVVGEEHYQDRLRPLHQRIGSGREVVVELREVTQLPHEGKIEGAAVLVSFGGEPIGNLTPAMSERYLPLVRRVTSAGFPASVAARISDGGKKLEVELLLWSRRRLAAAVG